MLGCVAVGLCWAVDGVSVMAMRTLGVDHGLGGGLA